MPSDPHDVNDKKASGDDTATGHAAPQLTFYEKQAKHLRELSGNLTNQAIGALAHVDLGQKFSEPINGALAREYIKGRTILEQRQAQGKRADDLAGLCGEELASVKAYQKVRSDLPAQIPFIDRDALVREVERNIEIKANVSSAPEQAKGRSPSLEKIPPAHDVPSVERSIRAPASAPPIVKETSVKAQANSIAKDAAVRSSGLAAAKEPGVKASNAPSKDATANVSAPPRMPDASLPAAKASHEKDQTAKDLSDRPAKAALDHQPAQGQGSRALDQPAPKAPPKPHEAEARELKGRDPAGATDTVAVHKLIPPPHPQPGADSKQAQPRSEHSSLENADLALTGKSSPVKRLPGLSSEKDSGAKTQLGAESALGRASASPAKLSPSVDRAPGAISPKTGSRLPTATDLLSKLAARPFAECDRKLALSGNESMTLRQVPADKTGRDVRLSDSAVFKIVAAKQALLFGRQFGLVEREVSVLHGAAQHDAGSKSLGLSNKSIASGMELTGHVDHAHTAGRATSGAGMTGQHKADIDNAGIGHAAADKLDASHPQRGGESHDSSQAHGHGVGESHHSSQSHGAGESHNANHSQAEGQGHDAGPPHFEAEAHEAGQTHNFDHSQHIKGADFGTNEVSHVGKLQDGKKESEDPRGIGVKTFVVKGFLPDKRYITGGELAFVAIMALASASRARPGENAAEQGLTQAHREYVLVEEESWLQPDYQVPAKNEKGGATKLSAPGDLDAKEPEPQDSQAREKSSTAGAQKTTQLRKILLRPQILVQEGDDLCQMAEALFNDSRFGHLIADINAHAIEQSYSDNTRIVRLITRQRLSLPVYQDITRFSAGQLEQAGDLPLVTIVESTAIDKELLHEGLSTMLGINSNNRDPLDQ